MIACNTSSANEDTETESPIYSIKPRANAIMTNTHSGILSLTTCTISSCGIPLGESNSMDRLESFGRSL